MLSGNYIKDFLILQILWVRQYYPHFSIEESEKNNKYLFAHNHK